MTDVEFIGQFENGTLPPEAFHHRDHVKAAWLYLHRYPVHEALQRFCDSLKNFAAVHGKANLYHETITWAYFLLIRERMKRLGSQNWEAFAAANPDLFDWTNNILKTYYREETLRSDIARQVFVLPDR